MLKFHISTNIINKFSNHLNYTAIKKQLENYQQIHLQKQCLLILILLRNNLATGINLG